jgi:hypothetical protein
MKIKDEIKFWKKAINIIEAGYGKDCKDFDLRCVECQSRYVVSWIDHHIDLLEWELRQSPNKNKMLINKTKSHKQK